MMFPRAPVAALALLAAAHAAAPAHAGVTTVDARIAFRNDHAANNTPTGDAYTISSTGTYEFQVLFGVFDAQGFTNHGMFNHIGSLTLADPHNSTTMAPRAGGARRAPYTFGPPPLDGVPGNPINFDANRGIATIIVPWELGQPEPSADAVRYSNFNPADPTSGGAPDEYFPGYRFTVTVTNLAERTVTVTASGLMQAVAAMDVLSSAPPDDEGPGFVEFYPFQFINDTTSSVLTLHIIPAPGAGALLALSAAVAARRRRA